MRSATLLDSLRKGFKMLVEVTQEDIDDGSPGDCHLCPIARALARMHGQSPEVSDFFVHDARVVIRDGGHIILPEVATEFIKRFDGWQPVQPFSFDLCE